jgi:hypothetical protein
VDRRGARRAAPARSIVISDKNSKMERLANNMYYKSQVLLLYTYVNMYYSSTSFVILTAAYLIQPYFVVLGYGGIVRRIASPQAPALSSALGGSLVRLSF